MSNAPVVAATFGNKFCAQIIALYARSQSPGLMRIDGDSRMHLLESLPVKSRKL
jgi:hypothetical protein